MSGEAGGGGEGGGGCNDKNRNPTLERGEKYRQRSMEFQLSPTTLWIFCLHDTCFPLVPTCLPFVPQYTLDAHDFTLVFHFSTGFLLHSGFFARMILHLSPTCTCVAHLLLCISYFSVTCGLLVSDFTSGRQQEFQISNY